MRLLFAGWLCLGLLILSGCASFKARDSEATDRLARCMAERLLISCDVAWSKAHSGAPVLDPARESVLLAALVRRGKDAGLDQARVERFFIAQIAASREVQTELLDAWASGRMVRPQTAPLDLRTQIRPRMDAASAALITSLANFPNEGSPARRERVAGVLRESGFSDRVISRALAGF
jgi:chorismate mutase